MNLRSLARTLSARRSVLRSRRCTAKTPGSAVTSPARVVRSAALMPPVRPPGSEPPAAESVSKLSIIPVTVPRSPRSGRSATITLAQAASAAAVRLTRTRAACIMRRRDAAVAVAHSRAGAAVAAVQAFSASFRRLAPVRRIIQSTVERTRIAQRTCPPLSIRSERSSNHQKPASASFMAPPRLTRPCGRRRSSPRPRARQGSRRLPRDARRARRASSSRRSEEAGSESRTQGRAPS